ncbi:hypothetical protein ACSSS7_002487 [Eimeria intestinalis]
MLLHRQQQQQQQHGAAAAQQQMQAVREGACLKPKSGASWGAPSWSEGALDCLYSSYSSTSLHEGSDEVVLGGPQIRGPPRQEGSPSCPSLPAYKELLSDLETVPFKGRPQGALDLFLASPVRDSGEFSPLQAALLDDRQQQQQQEGSDAEVALLLRQQLQQLRRDGQLRAARLRRERQQLQQELAEARQQQQLLQLRRQQHRSSNSSNSSRSSARKWSDRSSDEGLAPELLPQLPRGARGAPLGPPFQGAPWPAFSPRMVLLHVYDLTPAISAYVNRVMRPLGAGAFHAGVEVYGQEYCFGQTPGLGFRVRVLCECRPTDLGLDEFASLIEAIKFEWPGNSYDVLSRNCVDFADHLCVLLGVGHIPAWLFRLQNQARTIKGGARAAAAAAAAAARQLQRLDREAGITATAAAAAEAAATAAAATAAAATTAAVSLGRFFKQAHQVRDKRLRAAVGAPQGPPQRGTLESSQGGPGAPHSFVDTQRPRSDTRGPLAAAGGTQGLECCRRGPTWYRLLNPLPCALLRPLKGSKWPPGSCFKGPPKCTCCKKGPWWNRGLQGDPLRELVGASEGPRGPRPLPWRGRRQAPALLLLTRPCMRASAAAAKSGCSRPFMQCLRLSSQESGFPNGMGRYLMAGVSFLGDRLADGVSCIPTEWHEEDFEGTPPHQAYQRAHLPPSESSEGPPPEPSEGPLQVGAPPRFLLAEQSRGAPKNAVAHEGGPTGEEDVPGGPQHLDPLDPEVSYGFEGALQPWKGGPSALRGRDSSRLLSPQRIGEGHSWASA